MQRHILFTTVVIIWLLALAACGAPDTATDSGSTLSADAAAEIALEHAPGASLVETPRLVSYQGATAYEVLLDQGPLYVDAQSGTVITTGAPTVAPTAPPDVAVTPTIMGELPTATAVPLTPTPEATAPPEAPTLPPAPEPTNPPPPRPDVPPAAEPEQPPPGPDDRPRDNPGDAVGPIPPEQAIQLATEAVGGGTVTEIKLERGDRDKPPVYKIKFDNDSEVELNARTGEIIEVKIRDKPTEPDRGRGGGDDDDDDDDDDDGDD